LNPPPRTTRLACTTLFRSRSAPPEHGGRRRTDAHFRFRRCAMGVGGGGARGTARLDENRSTLAVGCNSRRLSGLLPRSGRAARADRRLPGDFFYAADQPGLDVVAAVSLIQ